MKTAKIPKDFGTKFPAGMDKPDPNFVAPNPDEHLPTDLPPPATPTPATTGHTPGTVASQIARTFNMLGTGDPGVEIKAAKLIRELVEQTKNENLVSLKSANDKARIAEAEAASLRESHARLLEGLKELIEQAVAQAVILNVNTPNAASLPELLAVIANSRSAIASAQLTKAGGLTQAGKETKP